MKHVLLATTALAMTSSLAAAEVSLSGRAGAGVATTATAGTNGVTAGVKSEIWSGIDLNVSASVTTDTGVTVSVADDFGGGKLPDYADKELDTQSSDLDTPAVTVATGGWSITMDNQAIDDRYDNDQNGDISVDGAVGGLSVGITYDTDAAAGEAGTSYDLGYTMGDITLGVKGTDADDSGNAAMEWTGSYAMGDMTLSLSSDNKGDAEDITEFGIAYAMGDLSVSMSADDNNDWNASASYTAGGVSVSYATDEESAWEADVSYALGSGASVKASTDSTDFSVVGVEFTF